MVVSPQLKHVDHSQELLDEQAITLSPQDQISMPLNGAIQDGDRIIIDRAIPVKVTVGDNQNHIYIPGYG